MTDTAWNEAASWPAIVAAVLAFTTLLVYGVGSAWYRSLLGASLFLRFASLPAIVAFAAARRLASIATTGSVPSHSDGLGLAAFVLYTALALIELLALVVLLIERRRAPTLQIKHRRRKAHR